ncbi:PAS domain-containing protein [Chondromyces apiculatus]|uniref:Anti-sigma-factor antagonist n=1 Tax=Chondromyces apiculatus DSM 436 TaxID=1192034 RepID=A0A017TCU1_9BACT|nr:PAS domain-containing protein [Chondromyces apiculatus]EYF06451.1 anti-sigma-factor antagonist [Chondromyces apiculatus DSM 436]
MAPLVSFLSQAHWGNAEFLQHAIDILPDPIFVKDRRHRWMAINRSFSALLGQAPEAIIGKSDPDYHPKEQVEVFWEHDDLVFDSGEPDENEEVVTAGDGSLRTLWTRKFPMKADTGEVLGLCGIITDVTVMKQRLREAELIQAEHIRQQSTITAQAELLDRMAMPVLQIWQGVLLMPIVGELNRQRATLALQNLLDAVVRSQSHHLLLDLTGMPLVDTSVARYILHAVKAVELLGCTCVLVGIGPEIARTLVHLDVDLGKVVTKGTLQSGLAHVLGRLLGGQRAGAGARRAQGASAQQRKPML